MSDTATNRTEISKFKMLDGSSSAGSYLAFAINGNAIIGVKPYTVQDGKTYGIENTTLVTLRLRSTKVSRSFDEESKVVKLSDNFSDWTSPWPAIKFDKKQDHYASTAIAIFMHGNPQETPEQFSASFVDGEFTAKLADYLISLVGIEQMILTAQELVSWLDDYYAPVINGILTKLAKQKAFKEEMSTKIGQFGIMKELMQTIHETNISHQAKDDEAALSPSNKLASTMDDDHGDHDYDESDSDEAQDGEEDSQGEEQGKPHETL